MFKLIDLPYHKEALEPVISSKTIEFHYGKHLQGYVDNLNKLIAGLPYEQMPLESIVRHSEGGIFNNSGQVLNHNLYFTQFQAPKTFWNGKELSVEAVSDDQIRAAAPSLSRQIEAQWGSLQAFRAEFEAKGATLFGSGWVWLSAKQDGTLAISQEPGAHNPVLRKETPLLTFDVWEHAYYLDYQNRRPAHLSALWNIVNWKVIEARYTKNEE